MNTPATLPDHNLSRASVVGCPRLIAPCLLAAALLASHAASLRADDLKPQVEGKSTSAKAKADAEDRFIRILKEGGKPVAMQTSIVRYVPAPGSPWAASNVTVDLIGAVHVGEKAYYDFLNKEFRKYDAMLYELVAPEGTRIPKGGGKPGGSPVSMIQGGMKDILGLEFQLERVDYTQKNFVHADMTPEEMSKSMQDRGESVVKMLFKMMGQGFAQQATGATNDVEVLMALFAEDRSVRLKRILARQVTNMETLEKALAGKDGSSTLIGERNRKALSVMEREVTKNKRRRIAIFYGAGHLADFEMRLEKDFRLKPTGEPRWITAWDLTK